jgi:hypothetical protein
MVSTRSKQTSYTIDFTGGTGPVKGNEHPISKYYAQSGGGQNSVLLMNRLNLINQ